MTIEHTGRRLARYRKLAGFRTPADLAAATSTGAITAATVQNVESGRKAELSIAQVVDLTRTMGIAPASLMADVMHPFEVSVIAPLTNWELINSLGIPGLLDTAPDAAARRVILSTRTLVSIQSEWPEAVADLRRSKNAGDVPIEFDTPMGPFFGFENAREQAEFALAAMHRAAQTAHETLVELGMPDVRWSAGPWLTYRPRDGVDQTEA